MISPPPAAPVRILGIDPGLANTGYGVIEHDGNASRVLDHGCIKTDSDTATAQRLAAIYSQVAGLITRWEPQVAAFELLYFGINVKSAMAVGEGRGAAILATARHDLIVAEYTPQQIKQAVTGTGRAGKDQVLKMVRVLLNLQELPNTSHAADALAVALCHAHTSKFADAVSKSLGATPPRSGGRRSSLGWLRKTR